MFRLLKQCHLNCTNYILLNGRITTNDQIGKKWSAHGPFQSLTCFWHNIMQNLEDTNCFQRNISFQITTSNSVFAIVLYRQVSFYATLHSWKMPCQSKLHKSNTKFPFKIVYYLGVTTSSYTVYNYTTSGHIVYLLYIQYIHISIQCTYISIQYMYFLLMQ